MRKFVFLVVIALGVVLVLTAANPSPASAGSPVKYCTVRHGERMDGIAGRYGVSTWALARANGIWDNDSIYEGQMLYIPCSGCWYPQYPSQYGNNNYYQGNNYYQQPVQYNYGGSCGSSYGAGCSGQYPNPYPRPNPRPGPIYRCSYQVHYGDTMSAIAWRLGVDMWTLARNNGIYNLNWIYAGMWLRVPGCYL